MIKPIPTVLPERGSGTAGNDVGGPVPDAAMVVVDVGREEHRYSVSVEQIVQPPGIVDVPEAVTPSIRTLARVVEWDMGEDKRVGVLASSLELLFQPAELSGLDPLTGGVQDDKIAVAVRKRKVGNAKHLPIT